MEHQRHYKICVSGWSSTLGWTTPSSNRLSASRTSLMRLNHSDKKTCSKRLTVRFKQLIFAGHSSRLWNDIEVLNSCALSPNRGNWMNISSSFSRFEIIQKQAEFNRFSTVTKFLFGSCDVVIILVFTPPYHSFSSTMQIITFSGCYPNSFLLQQTVVLFLVVPSSISRYPQI